MYTDDEEDGNCSTVGRPGTTETSANKHEKDNIPKPKLGTRPGLRTGNSSSRKRKQKHGEQSNFPQPLEQGERLQKLAKSKQDYDSYTANQAQRCEALEQEVAQLKKELYEKNERIKKYETQINTLTSSLASEMNKKVSANESSLENISIQCRPMNIAEEYSNLCSNAWLDAKQALDDMDIDQETSTKFLCDILMVSHSAAETYYHTAKSTLSKLLHSPFAVKIETQATSDQNNVRMDESSIIPQDVVVAVGDHFRREANDVEIDPLIKKIKECLRNREHGRLEWNTVVKEEAVCAYIDQSARIAWKMVIQRPPMTFQQADVNKLFKGEKEHPLAWGSNPSKNALVRYYQYPTMLHGSSTMVKGKVLVN